MKFLEIDLVKINICVDSAEEAIRNAGDLLLKKGLIESSYIESMIHSYQKNEAYFVLAPQIAIPHARPAVGVKQRSLELVTLTKPIDFGNKNNEPVKLIFCLGASTIDEHLLLLKRLTALLNNSTNIETLINATSYNDIKNIVKE